MHDNLLARSDGVPSAVDFLLGTRDEREQREQREQLLRAPEARVEVAARGRQRDLKHRRGLANLRQDELASFAQQYGSSIAKL